MEMKMMLSIPSTISMTTSVKSEINPSTDKISAISSCMVGID
jgi:hypothetical protein